MIRHKVALRGGFSDRNRIKEENTIIQLKDLDMRTRVQLINLTDIIWNYFLDDCQMEYVQKFIKHLLADVYIEEVDSKTHYSPAAIIDVIKSTIREDCYDAVLTVIEYIARSLYSPWKKTIISNYNRIFTEEFVGYRFVNDTIMPITDEIEIDEIQLTITKNPYEEVRKHIEKALDFLGDREKPDYKNSIKESITAVERICSEIVGHKATLGDALKQLEKSGVQIHPALKTAFEKLYGYTSDASGIRHAGQLDGTDSTFEEAKFMVVVCCSFINYLTGLKAKEL